MMRALYRKVSALLCCALALSNAAASAQQIDAYCGPPPPSTAQSYPHFWDERLNFTVLDQDGKHILMVEGGFGQNEGPRFESALSSAGSIDEVWFSSPGGNVDSGLAIGRALRKHGLMVRVPYGHQCVSSCTNTFLGGVIRTVDNGAYYGVHMFSMFSDTPYSKVYADRLRNIVFASAKVRQATTEKEYQRLLMDIEQESATQAAILARYMVEMSASLDLTTSMFGQTQQGVCYLNGTGLSRYNVVNAN